MRDFAALLDRLAYTPQRVGKLRLLADYLRRTRDPDRGYALAALTDGLPIRLPVRRTLAGLIEARSDPVLYRLSRDYVGDTAETVALLWPEAAVGDAGADPAQAVAEPPRLADVVERLQVLAAPRQAGPLAGQMTDWLDRLDATGRWALIKLLTGGLRVGVSARLAKQALSSLGPDAIGVDAIEEIWHGLAPPYLPLFAWLEGRGPRPDIGEAPVFRPMMLAHPLAEEDWPQIDLATFAAEWKWDGIRVQVSARNGAVRLFSRTGDDIGASFPDVMPGLAVDAVLDGELLVMREGVVAPFADLQQRLNRRAVSRSLLASHPAHIRLYDALALAGEDLRPLPFAERRARLEAWHAVARPARTDLSPFVVAASLDDLHDLWRATRAAGIEGMMLKRRDSPYLAGRPKGHWYKWKRAPLTADCVLMYAQRGSGRRSSLHSDFTFGAWEDDGAGGRVLVPVGKAYSGFTDAELLRLDRFVREATVDRYGPVRALAATLVVEVAFDAVQASPRHKSGIAMRFPRFARIRWDKPAAEADDVATLRALIAA